MALYHMLFGIEPAAGVALGLLGLKASEIARFRDAYFTWADPGQATVAGGDPVIVVLTRTGGGNRDDYGAENDALAARPGYRFDTDSSVDATYAEFVFDVPAAQRPDVIAYLLAEGAPRTLQQKHDAMRANLASPPKRGR